MTVKEKKKKVQVNIDQELVHDVDSVLNSLGMNPTILITALYKRVAAQGGIPFDLSLTEREKALLSLDKSLDLVPTKHAKDLKELTNWLDETAE